MNLEHTRDLIKKVEAEIEEKQTELEYLQTHLDNLRESEKRLAADEPAKPVTPFTHERAQEIGLQDGDVVVWRDGARYAYLRISQYRHQQENVCYMSEGEFEMDYLRDHTQFGMQQEIDSLYSVYRPLYGLCKHCNNAPALGLFRGTAIDEQRITRAGNYATRPINTYLCDQCANELVSGTFVETKPKQQKSNQWYVRAEWKTFVRKNVYRSEGRQAIVNADTREQAYETACKQWGWNYPAIDAKLTASRKIPAHMMERRS